MNKHFSLLTAVAITLISLLSFSSASSASLAYIGDQVAAKTVNRLEGQNLGHLEIDALTKHAYRTASIIGYRDWLPSALQSIDASPVKMIIVSLGMNDMRSSNHDFPDAATLDASVREILDNLTPRGSVYWVLPHKIAASSEAHHPGQRGAIVAAIARAKNSGQYPKLFLVDIDAMAYFYSLNMAEMLNSSDIYLSNDGADIAAEYVIGFGNLMKLVEP
jgi:lysophospholipase L1-like esterase